MDHELPFHTSARVISGPELGRKPPTPVQPPAVVHDTPTSTLSCAPEGLGTASKDQEVPFHSSARASSSLELLK